ncbi:hypothetical protein BG004_000941 [Podila humilis]|nr:hypothetical protein BG004_000941 [Podila humilis]
MSESISINVRASNKKHSITLNATDTVLDLKTKVALACDTPVERMRLIYSGRVLKDPALVSSYKIADGHTIHMVRSAPPSNKTNINGEAPSSPTSQTARATAIPQSVSPDATPIQSAPLPNPWAGMTPNSRNTVPGFGGLAGASGMGGMGGMGFEPEMVMNNMMQDPNFAQYMSSLLQNPQVLQSMISTNPMLQAMGPEVQQMLHSPEFQRMISSPDMLRQVAQMNPLMGNPQGRATGGMTNPWDSPLPTGTGTGTGGGTRTGATGTSPLRSAPTPFNPFGSFGSATGAAIQPSANLWSQYMASIGSGTTRTSPLQPQQQQPLHTPQTPEQRFQVQLQQLNEMGFWDAAKNVRALVASGGNVNSAIELLFTGAPI